MKIINVKVGGRASRRSESKIINVSKVGSRGSGSKIINVNKVGSQESEVFKGLFLKNSLTQKLNPKYKRYYLTLFH